MTQIRISIMAVLLLAITLSTEAGQRRILRHEHPVKDSYIVLINQIEPAAVESVCRDLARTYHITLAKKPDGADSILKYAMQGFSGVAKEEDALDLAEDPRVAAVEQNALLETSGALPPVVDQYNLDRLDDLSAQVDSSDTYVGNHRYDHQTSGRGVYIYIFDSGVERDHTEFDTDNDPSTPNLAPRVKDGVIFANDGHPAYHPCGGIDSSNGYKTGTHGTAVASVAAGRTVGAAPDAYIVPVRVIQCDGVAELQWWCWGMDWVAGPANPYPKRPAVLNASVFIKEPWPGDPTPISSFQSTITNVVAAGITVVVSANNQSDDACLTTPANMAYGNAAYFTSPYHVISVGGLDQRDRLWRCTLYNDCNPWELVSNPGSNTGRCVDIYAPAHDLKLAWNTGYSNYRADVTQRSGTSFAAPLVTGVIARILERNPNLTPGQVWSQVLSKSLDLTWNFDGDSIDANDIVIHMNAAE